MTVMPTSFSRSNNIKTTCPCGGHHYVYSGVPNEKGREFNKE